MEAMAKRAMEKAQQIVAEDTRNTAAMLAAESENTTAVDSDAKMQGMAEVRDIANSCEALPQQPAQLVPKQVVLQRAAAARGKECSEAAGKAGCERRAV